MLLPLLRTGRRHVAAGPHVSLLVPGLGPQLVLATSGALVTLIALGLLVGLGGWQSDPHASCPLEPVDTVGIHDGNPTQATLTIFPFGVRCTTTTARGLALTQTGSWWLSAALVYLGALAVLTAWTTIGAPFPTPAGRVTPWGPTLRLCGTAWSRSSAGRRQPGKVQRWS